MRSDGLRRGLVAVLAVLIIAYLAAVIWGVLAIGWRDMAPIVALGTVVFALTAAALAVRRRRLPRASGAAQSETR